MNRRPYATRKVSKEEYEEDLKRREESAERAKEWVAKKFANPLDELTAKWEKCEKENNGHIYGVVGDEESLLRKRKMVMVRCVACNYQYLAEPETTQKLPEYWDELGRWSGLQRLCMMSRRIVDEMEDIPVTATDYRDDPDDVPPVQDEKSVVTGFAGPKAYKWVKTHCLQLGMTQTLEKTTRRGKIHFTFRKEGSPT